MSCWIKSQTLAGVACCILSIISSLPVASADSPKKQTFVLNSEASTLTWTGKKITGSHTGRIQLKSANPIIEDGKLIGGNFVVDMGSIVNDDLKDEAYNAKLTSHLKSEDFFNVANFPLTELKLTKVEPMANAKSGEPNYLLSGDLTIIGATNPISFPATVTIDKSKAHATAKVSVDRTKWNLKYGSGKFFTGLGDKLIYDEFTVEVEIVGDLH